MNFCLYPFVFFSPDRWNVRIVRRNVRNIRSLFVSRSLVFSFQRKIVNVCFPVDGHKYASSDASLKDLRLACLCTLGFAAFLRFDELSSIVPLHLSITPDYLKIFIPRAKNDVYREGYFVYVC